MIIKRPVKTNDKTQAFGESKACAKVVNGETVKPYVIKGTSTGTCTSGYIPFYEALGMEGHNGEDWRTWNGEPLYFPVEADVEWWTRSSVDADGGIGLDVFSSKRIHLEELPPHSGRLAEEEYQANNGRVYVKFRFWHLKKVLVADARRPTPEDFRPAPNVIPGQLIAYCDSTGASSGHHLHWSMKIVAENSMTLDGNNGYYGAVDFSKWFTNEYILGDPNVVLSPLQTLLMKMIVNLKALRDALQKKIDLLKKV